VEALTIVDDIALGPAGVSGVTLNVFFAYDTTATPGELYYSGAPLAVAIAEQVQQPADPQSLTLFTQNIAQPIILSVCRVCHVSGGAASATPLTYVASGDSTTVNYNTLLDYVQSAPNAADTLIAKPQGQESHGGGTLLSAGSVNLTNWIAFVNALQADAQP